MRETFIFNSEKFVEMLKAQWLSLESNLQVKIYKHKNHYNKKIMMLCYQLASLWNKQVSGTKTTIGLFLLGSETFVVCINTLANMGICSTYQTVYNELKKTVSEYKISVENYIKDCKTDYKWLFNQ